MDTNNKFLEILYYLEDCGMDVDLIDNKCDDGDTFYKFSNKNDFDNALTILNDYDGIEVKSLPEYLELQVSLKINEDLFSKINEPKYVFQDGDTITTPSDFPGEAFCPDSKYTIIKDGDLYRVQYLDLYTLTHRNIIGGQGDLDDLFPPTSNIEQLSRDIFNYDKNITLDMINRNNPDQSWTKNGKSSDLEELIDFWNRENVGNFKVEWLDSNRIKVIDTYSNNQEAYVYEIDGNGQLSLYDSNGDYNGSWFSVEDYEKEYLEANDLSDINENTDSITEMLLEQDMVEDDPYDYEEALAILKTLDLSSESYSYYKQKLDDLHYADKVSAKELAYQSFEDVLEDASKAEQRNILDRQEIDQDSYSPEEEDLIESLGTDPLYDAYLKRLNNHKQDKEALESDLNDIKTFKTFNLIPADQKEDLINKFEYYISKLKENLKEDINEPFYIPYLKGKGLTDEEINILVKDYNMFDPSEEAYDIIPEELAENIKIVALEELNKYVQYLEKEDAEEFANATFKRPSLLAHIIGKILNKKNEELNETYSQEELDGFKNKVFNQRKIMSIYRKKKYGSKRLMCRTKCVNCGREKKLFLSNLVTNPEKYGSCICSDKNIDTRYDIINSLYKGTKKLKNNTSGYTGVSWVAKYRGEPYNKWRAYIDIDGQRNYLGDFNSKSKAIRARKAAAAKGIKWYAENKNEFMATSRKNRKWKRRAKKKKA